jgi:hypothetical protein
MTGQIFNDAFINERGDLVLQQEPVIDRGPDPNRRIPPLPRPTLSQVWFLQHVGRFIRDSEGHDIGVAAISFRPDGSCLVQLMDNTARLVDQDLNIVMAESFVAVTHG